MVGTESTCIDKLVFSAVLFTFGRKASVSTIRSKRRGMLIGNEPEDLRTFLVINCIISWAMIQIFFTDMTALVWSLRDAEGRRDFFFFHERNLRLRLRL